MSGYGGPGFIGNNAYLISEPYVLNQMKAGEDIGFEVAYDASQFPVNPLISFGIPLRVSNPSTSVWQDIPVFKTGNTLATATGFVGVSNSGAKLGNPISVRNRGDIHAIVGSSSVTAGDLVILDINSTENSSGAFAGDVVPLSTAADTYGTPGSLADTANRLSALVGRALTSGSARVGTGAGQYSVVRVRMRGF